MKKTLKQAAAEYCMAQGHGKLGSAIARNAFIAGAEWQKRKGDEDHAAQLMLFYQKGYDDARRLHFLETCIRRRKEVGDE